MPYSLTSQKISFTYGRLVQRVSGSYYDGFGNLLNLSGTVLYTGSSYPITSSWSNNSETADVANYALSSSVADNADTLDGHHGSWYQKSLQTGSSYPITASWSQTTLTSSYTGYASSSLYSQDIIVYVKNGSGATIPKGKVVRIIGADNSANTPTVGLADWTNDGNSANTLGFMFQSLDQGSFGYVLTEGKFLNINTQAFNPGDLLYLASSGSITNVPPVAPKHGVRLGEVIRSQLNNGSIYVRIDNGAELGELHDVVDTTTTASYGDLLMKSGSVWKNSRNLTGSYSLEGTFVLTHVSQSLNFVNDAAAAAGGVPKGGLYRNGNAIQIRIV